MTSKAKAEAKPPKEATKQAQAPKETPKEATKQTKDLMEVYDYCM